MLKTRIITAIFLLLGLFAVVFFASVKLWALLCLLLALLGIREWSSFVPLSTPFSYVYLASAFVLGLGIFMLPYTSYAEYQNIVILLLLGSASFFWIVVAPIWLIRKKAFQSRLAMSSLG